MAHAVRTGQSLASLSCRAEQALLADKMDLLESRYDEICDRCGRKAALLDQALANARLFGEDEVEVLNWLAEVEDKLTSVSVKDYQRDVLQKQHADQLVFSASFPPLIFHDMFWFLCFRSFKSFCILILTDSSKPE